MGLAEAWGRGRWVVADEEPAKVSLSRAEGAHLL